MTARIEFLDLGFDTLGSEAVEQWIDQRTPSSPFGYVVTPNVDHMVRLSTAMQDVRDAYAAASLCVCDSRVLYRIARLCGVQLSVVPGSDLVAALFSKVLKTGDRICLIGGDDAQAACLQAKYPKIVLFHHGPPMGLRDDAGARATAIAFVERSAARITLIAVGSPQQEILAYEMARGGRVHGTGLCIGASVDFLLGTQSRAPRIMQRAGLEWFWRLATQPRRLARRYLVDGPAIFPMAVRWRSRTRRGV